ncbi:Uncharacterized protein TCM_006182 [Theobroma cacao]|uniref:Uncharacterized protein n=1 Tax=Theobroma cacao TaxID=3641 RepID=A0A061DYB7_THECC|nr:Uncharacterized protein TCM_006182 [Theobroma cacao]
MGFSSLVSSSLIISQPNVRISHQTYQGSDGRRLYKPRTVPTMRFPSSFCRLRNDNPSQSPTPLPFPFGSLWGENIVSVPCFHIFIF